jgi:hypothetical protein
MTTDVYIYIYIYIKCLNKQTYNRYNLISQIDWIESINNNITKEKKRNFFAEYFLSRTYLHFW